MFVGTGEFISNRLSELTLTTGSVFFSRLPPEALSLSSLESLSLPALEPISLSEFAVKSDSDDSESELSTISMLSSSLLLSGSFLLHILLFLTIGGKLDGWSILARTESKCIPGNLNGVYKYFPR